MTELPDEDTPVEIKAVKKNETDFALLLDDGARDAWFVAGLVDQVGDNLWQMPLWLARDKGFWP